MDLSTIPAVPIHRLFYDPVVLEADHEPWLASYRQFGDDAARIFVSDDGVRVGTTVDVLFGKDVMTGETTLFFGAKVLSQVAAGRVAQDLNICVVELDMDSPEAERLASLSWAFKREKPPNG